MLVVNIIGISFIAIFLLFIFQKKKKLTSDYMLIITMFLISIIFSNNIWTKYDLNTFNFILDELVSFYILPSFLAYSMLLISEDNKLKKEWWLFTTFAIIFTIFVFIDFTVLTEYNAEKLQEEHESASIIYQYFYRGSNVFALIALAWFLKKLKHYQKKIKDNFSFIETIKLTWLKTFTWVYLINNGLILIITLAFSLWQIGSLESLYLVVFLLIVLSLFYLCYHGIRQYSLNEFNNSIGIGSKFVNEEKKSIKVSEGKNIDKYKTSSLSIEEMKFIFNQIKQLFEIEEVYLEPQLKIQDLALNLDLNIHKVSQTINTIADKSFYDFVNSYRVNHFKRLLSNSENKKYTILALGIESGFNSKATLNRIFKQQIGVSPKEFQKTSY